MCFIREQQKNPDKNFKARINISIQYHQKNYTLLPSTYPETYSTKTFGEQ